MIENHVISQRFLKILTNMPINRIVVIAIEPYSEFVKNKKLYDLIRSEIDKLTVSLSRFGKVKKFRIVPKVFKIEDVDLTPSLKVKSKEVISRYQHLIDEMYEK